MRGNDRRPAQESRHARGDHRGVALPVAARGARFFVQGDNGSDGRRVESVIALDGRVSVVEVQIVRGGRMGGNGMHAIAVGVGGFIFVGVVQTRVYCVVAATGLIGFFNLGVIIVWFVFVVSIIVALVGRVAVFLAPSKQRCTFRYGLAVRRSLCRCSGIGIDRATILGRRRQVTLQVRIHGRRLKE